MDRAGIKEAEFIIGGVDKLQLEGLDEFEQLVRKQEGKVVNMVVYNAHEGRARAVAVVPNREWGGKGLLGC